MARKLTVAEFEAAIRDFERESVHLEMRDAYGTVVELPHMAAWAVGEPDDLAWLQPWCDDLRRFTAEGKSVRRARIVSEPLSDYRRWSYHNATAMVDAGEDIRWVPRRLVSSVALPGNDFFMLDRRLVIFLHYAGSGLNTDFTTSTDPHDIQLCGAAFEAVWRLAVQHSEYKPL
jgi:hypothetical protein